MKAFNDSPDVKRRAMQDAALARMGGHYYAWGHYWHYEFGEKNKGNVTGAVLHPYLKPGQTEHDLPGYWETEMGIPWQVGEMIDSFFSGMGLHHNSELHHRWAEQVIAAIREGADLSRVPDQMAAYILEQPEWLALYADDWAHQVGVMHGIVILRLNGIDQEKRIKDFYYDHIHKLHRHQYQGQKSECRAALRSLCHHYRESGRGPYSYFLQHVVEGSARHAGQAKAKRWVALSQIFLQLLEDC